MNGNVKSTSRIMGGYILLPREIAESAVSKMSPCAREVFHLFLREANHKDVFAGGRQFQRGELITSYKQIREHLCWYIGFRKQTYTDDQCEAALKALVKEGMITKQKTTRGLIVTVCKYDYWQTASNYQNHTETDMSAARKPQSTATINKNEKNEKKKENNNTVHELNFSFMQFWTLYDKKIGNVLELQEKWGKLTDDERAKIMEYLPRYKRSKPEKRYMKNPETFLDKRAWEDEIPGELKKPQTTYKQADDNNWFFDREYVKKIEEENLNKRIEEANREYERKKTEEAERKQYFNDDLPF